MNTVHSYLFWLLSTLVLATPDDTRARELYRNGVVLYDEGSYNEALLAFQEAYNLSKRHALLYNMSKTLAKMERYEESLEALKKYRVYAPLEKQKELKEESLQLIGKLEAQKSRRSRLAAEKQKQEEQAQQEAQRKQLEAEQQRQRQKELQARYEEQQAQQKRMESTLRYGGGAVAIIGAGVAITSFAISRNQIQNFDKDGYESLQPINHAGIAVAVVGAGSVLGSLFLPKPLPQPAPTEQEP